MMYMLRHRNVLRLATIAFVACACAPLARTASPDASSASSLAGAPVITDTVLDAAQRRWVDSTLATLSLRDRVGQMVMVWMLGDYANTRDSAYAEVIRWV